MSDKAVTEPATPSGTERQAMDASFLHGPEGVDGMHRGLCDCHRYAGALSRGRRKSVRRRPTAGNSLSVNVVNSAWRHFFSAMTLS